LFNYLAWTLSPIAVFLIAFKFYSLNKFQKKTKFYLRLRVLSFYRTDAIQSTNSTRKRAFMAMSNRITIIIYACLFPVSMLIGWRLLIAAEALLDRIFK
jgi:hypothetical protein